jgi:hypothetical protein
MSQSTVERAWRAETRGAVKRSSTRCREGVAGACATVAAAADSGTVAILAEALECGFAAVGERGTGLNLRPARG